MPLCGPIRRLVEDARVVLVYGESGVGKTTFALEVLREFCSTRCLYVSTERLDFLRRASLMGIDLERVVVYDAVDASDFLELVTSRSLPRMDVVVVDSINSFMEAGAVSYVLTGLAAATLYSLAERYGVIVIETAQVRWSPEGLRPLGGKALTLWSRATIKLARVDATLREARLNGARYEYRVTEAGLEWLNC